MNKQQLKHLFIAIDMLVTKRIAESTGSRSTHYPKFSDIVDRAAQYMGIVDHLHDRPRMDQYGNSIYESDSVEL